MFSVIFEVLPRQETGQSLLDDQLGVLATPRAVRQEEMRADDKRSYPR